MHVLFRWSFAQNQMVWVPTFKTFGNISSIEHAEYSLFPLVYRQLCFWVKSRDKSKVLSQMKEKERECRGISLSNANASVWPQMEDLTHFCFPLEMCYTHIYVWCQRDKANRKFQLKGESTAFYSFTSPLVGMPLTEHSCHYQRRWIIQTLPLNLFCSKLYLI